MRILVTGASGFNGAHVVRDLLDHGYTVAVVLREGSSIRDVDARATVLRHDGGTEQLYHLVAGFGPERAVHVASKFIAAHTPGDIDSLVESNLRFGCQLLDGLTRAGCGVLVNFGTSWQHYGGEGYRPVSLYAATKQAFEDLAAYYVDVEGLRMVTLKLSDTYGPGDRRGKLVSALAASLQTGARFAMSEGAQKLNFAHVNDVAAAVRIALDRAAALPAGAAESFAVRGAETLSLRAFVELFGEIAGRPIGVDWGARPYRTREVMEPWMGETLPGWSPKIGLREGLAALIGGGAA